MIAEKHEAVKVVVDFLVAAQRMRSCGNCLHANNNLYIKSEESFKCTKFGVVPPINVIFFSCGAEWEADIPF
jgi:hypothetical protein